MLSKVVSVCLHPKQFFKKLDEPLQPAVVLTLALMGIAFLPQVLANYLSLALVNRLLVFLGQQAEPLSFFAAFFSTLFSYVFFVLSFVICIPLFHWYLRLFGAKGTMTHTAQLTLYGMVPILLVQWVPILGVFLGLAASVYAFVIQVFGCIELHKMSKKQLMWAFLWVPLLAMFAITLLVGAVGLWMAQKTGLI